MFHKRKDVFIMILTSGGDWELEVRGQKNL